MMRSPIGTSLVALAMLAGAAAAHAADNASASPPAASAAAVPAKPASGAPQPTPSMMFTASQVKSILKAIADHEHPPAVEAAAPAKAAEAAEAAAAPRVPNVYVSAVVDFGGGEWTVWANGQRVTPGHQAAAFQVLAVRGNSVDIEVPGEGGGRFRLEPYQTWRARDHSVVEGIVP